MRSFENRKIGYLSGRNSVGFSKYSGSRIISCKAPVKIVPFGITHFTPLGSSSVGPPMVISAYKQINSVKSEIFYKTQFQKIKFVFYKCRNILIRCKTYSCHSKNTHVSNPNNTLYFVGYSFKVWQTRFVT